MSSDEFIIEIDQDGAESVEVEDPVEWIIVINEGVPGPSAAIIDSGSLASPNLVSTAISLIDVQRQRVFIAGNGAPSTNPTLPNSGGTRELYLYGSSDVNTVELNDASNLKLSGQWYAVKDSVLYLIWDGATRWVEVSRNEI